MKQQLNAMKTYGSIALVALIALSACRKDNKDNSDTDTTVSLASGGSVSQSLYDDAFDVITTEGENNSVNGRVETCATVTLSPADTTTFPKTMTIDFGTGCVSSNGITRKGKIIATLSGKIRKSGSTASVTFSNYYVNNYHVEGTYSITTNSGSGNGINYTTAVSGGKITWPDGSTWFNYSGTHTLAQTGGIGTATISDDVFSWTGGFTSSSSAGKSLTVSITSPLVKSMSCKNIVSGVQTFTYNVISGSINYGDGTCDNQATLTVGSRTQQITLPR
ncbi:hypothetical protein A3860_00245 [Niastella vici]|uniref:Lipoprotein n=1 Tax=Niastella vici TaxID=1703345 RepID=A0A1V9G8P1_9BACT|nr:hypothetical protein [Niastella vici]OQP66836.1 hypothetical protein A3860_00245 [Niastella vici]